MVKPPRKGITLDTFLAEEMELVYAKGHDKMWQGPSVYLGSVPVYLGSVPVRTELTLLDSPPEQTHAEKEFAQYQTLGLRFICSSEEHGDNLVRVTDTLYEGEPVLVRARTGWYQTQLQKSFLRGWYVEVYAPVARPSNRRQIKVFCDFSRGLWVIGELLG